VGTSDYPVGTSCYPVTTNGYPVGASDYPVGVIDCPVGASGYPVGTNGYPVGIRVIPWVQVEGIKRVFGKDSIDDEVWGNKDCKEKDQVVYMLVRYAKAHPDTGRKRGPKCRPLCPGQLNNTHCLWKWHERPANYRRGCWNRRPWERHRSLFGDTLEQQETRKEREKRAWYDVIKVSNVLSHANVQKDWDRPESFLQSVMWC
jgi:hypothetical protein